MRFGSALKSPSYMNFGICGLPESAICRRSQRVILSDSSTQPALVLACILTAKAKVQAQRKIRLVFALRRLKFWSCDTKSLIEEGSGYWRYVPAQNGIRFLTWYDYQTRFGAAGRLIDRILFRPLIGWATAWSFDRLRLWIERGILPQVSFRFALIHAFARLGIAFIWLWQGLIPKLLFPSRDEVAMLQAVSLPIDSLVFIGVFELILAVAALALWRWRGFFLLNVLAMVGALATVALSSPSYLVAAFNPVTLNIATIVLSFIGYFAAVDLPSASRCLRKLSGESK
jgi:hypothetical protein